ncbi:MAG: ATP-binding cassette domain-containing protein, partial [Candidatus Spyradocola sp.]
PDNQMVATIVEEDVAFGLENLGVPPQEIQRRVYQALKAVGMTEYAASAPHMLSGGQKQRVAIAGVLAMKPDVILMDEPTAMLDPSGRREVMDTVQRLHDEEGMTVVLITHFMEEALRGDRVIVMEKGQTVLEGKPQQVFSQVERLKDIGLDVPPMTELAHRLRAHGIDVHGAPMNVEEMVEELCRLKQEN